MLWNHSFGSSTRQSPCKRDKQNNLLCFSFFAILGILCYIEWPAAFVGESHTMAWKGQQWPTHAHSNVERCSVTMFQSLLRGTSSALVIGSVCYETKPHLHLVNILNTDSDVTLRNYLIPASVLSVKRSLSIHLSHHFACSLIPPKTLPFLHQ